MAKIKIEEYDLLWADLYKETAEDMKDIFGESARDVKHIGATAIDGMMARPIVDVLLVIDRIGGLADYTSALDERGYSLAYIEDGDSRALLIKNGLDGNPQVKVYIFESEDKLEITRMTRFLAALKNDAAVAEKYLELRKSLAEKFPDDEESYRNGKLEFVESVVGKDAIKRKKKANMPSYAAIGACILGAVGFFVGASLLGMGVVGLLVGAAVGVLAGIGVACLNIF